MSKLHLRRLLSIKKMTAGELAERSGIPEETIRNIIYEKVRNPRIDTVECLSRALQVPIEQLLQEHAPDETELLCRYRLCNPDLRPVASHMVMSLADFCSSRNYKNIRVKSPDSPAGPHTGEEKAL